MQELKFIFDENKVTVKVDNLSPLASVYTITEEEGKYFVVNSPLNYAEHFISLGDAMQAITFIECNTEQGRMSDEVLANAIKHIEEYFNTDDNEDERLASEISFQKLKTKAVSYAIEVKQIQLSVCETEDNIIKLQTEVMKLKAKIEALLEAIEEVYGKEKANSVKGICDII